jgi:hypothetical protein
MNRKGNDRATMVQLYFGKGAIDKELWRMIKQLKKITGYWIAPNDVPMELEQAYRRIGNGTNLPFKELVRGAHRLIVTGHRSGNGVYGPANISKYECWIANCCPRDMLGEKQILHGRIGVNGVCVATTHITYGAFMSRWAILNAVIDENSEEWCMHGSHLCHVPPCINPLHITIEPQLENCHRIDCAKSNFCVDGAHSSPRCNPIEIDKESLMKLIMVKQAPVDYAERKRMMSEKPMYVASGETLEEKKFMNHVGNAMRSRTSRILLMKQMQMSGCYRPPPMM